MSNILVIEDQEPLCLLYRTVLASLQHAVVTATSGEDGLAAARRETPDVIILDLVMPGMSGAEVALALHEDPVLRDVPIILTTGINPQGPAEAAHAIGANVTLFKPFDMATLVDTLAGVLGGSG